MNKEKLKREVDELSQLEHNWDGYGAEPIKQEIINKVNYVIDHLDDTSKDPHVIPEPCDGVGLLWCGNKNSLLVSIGESSITYSYISREEEENNSYGVISNYDEINELLKKYGE